jgi:hypothetical protein
MLTIFPNFSTFPNFQRVKFVFQVWITFQTLEGCKFGEIRILKFGSLTRFGSLTVFEVWKFVRLEVWKFGRFEVCWMQGLWCITKEYVVRVDNGVRLV